MLCCAMRCLQVGELGVHAHVDVRLVDARRAAAEVLGEGERAREARVARDDDAALAGRDDLGRREREGAHVAERAEVHAVEPHAERLRGVLHQPQPARGAQGHERGQVRRAVVERDVHDGARARRE
jgi:hypothetical protein